MKKSTSPYAKTGRVIMGASVGIAGITMYAFWLIVALVIFGALMGVTGIVGVLGGMVVLPLVILTLSYLDRQSQKERGR